MDKLSLRQGLPWICILSIFVIRETRNRWGCPSPWWSKATILRKQQEQLQRATGGRGLERRGTRRWKLRPFLCLITADRICQVNPATVRTRTVWWKEDLSDPWEVFSGTINSQTFNLPETRSMLSKPLWFFFFSKNLNFLSPASLIYKLKSETQINSIFHPQKIPFLWKLSLKGVLLCANNPSLVRSQKRKNTLTGKQIKMYNNSKNTQAKSLKDVPARFPSLKGKQKLQLQVAEPENFEKGRIG